MRSHWRESVAGMEFASAWAAEERALLEACRRNPKELDRVLDLLDPDQWADPRFTVALDVLALYVAASDDPSPRWSSVLTLAARHDLGEWLSDAVHDCLPPLYLDANFEDLLARVLGFQAEANRRDGIDLHRLTGQTRQP